MTWRTIIALLVLLAAFVLVLNARLDWIVGAMIGALALAIITPPTRVG